MASRIHISPEDIKRSGIGPYDYPIDISTVVSEFDSKKSRFFNCMETLLNKYFSDVKNQNQEYDAKLVEFLLNNQQKFLEDLLEDSTVLDNMASIVNSIATSSTSSGASAFAGLSNVERDRVIGTLIQICNKAKDRIDISATTPGSRRSGRRAAYMYKRSSELLQRKMRERFENLYAGLWPKEKSSRRLDKSEKGTYVALPIKFISNDPNQTNTLYYKYKTSRGKTKSILAQLFTLTVMEKTEVDTMKRISEYTEIGLAKLDLETKRASRKGFIKGTKNVAKVLVFPFKMLTIRFWKKAYSFMEKQYASLLKNVVGGIIKTAIFPLEHAIYKNLKDLLNSKVVKFIKDVSSSLINLGKKLAGKVKMTVTKFVKGFVRLIRLPWFLIGLGVVLGKLFQGLVNQFIPDDSMFKTEEFKDLPLMGNETTLEALSKNKHLQPISKEITFIDNILHGINDFVLSIDKKDDPNNLFADIMGYDESNQKSNSKTRDYTFETLAAIHTIFDRTFIGTSDRPSFLKSTIDKLIENIVKPIQLKMDALNMVYNGLNSEKIIEGVKYAGKNVIDRFSNFMESFFVSFGFSAGAKAGGALMSLIPGGSLLKILGVLIGATSGAGLVSQIVGSAFNSNKGAFDKAYRDPDILLKRIEHDRAMHLEFGAGRKQDTLIKKALERRGFLYSESSEDSPQIKAFKAKVRSLASEVQSSISTASSASPRVGKFYHGERGESKNSIDSMLKALTTQMEFEEQDISNALKSAFIDLGTNSDWVNKDVHPDLDYSNLTNMTPLIKNFTTSNKGTSKISPKIEYEKTSPKLSTDDNQSTSIGKRILRLQYIHHILRMYKAGQLTTSGFIQNFNEKGDFDNLFYTGPYIGEIQKKVEDLFKTIRNGEKEKSLPLIMQSIAHMNIRFESGAPSAGFRSFSEIGDFEKNFKTVIQDTSPDSLFNFILESVRNQFGDTFSSEKLDELFKDKKFIDDLKNDIYTNTRGFTYESLINYIARKGIQTVKNNPLFNDYMNLCSFLVSTKLLENNNGGVFSDTVVRTSTDVSKSVSTVSDTVKEGFDVAWDQVKASWAAAVSIEEKKGNEVAESGKDAKNTIEGIVSEKEENAETLASANVLLGMFMEKIKKFHGKPLTDVHRATPTSERNPEGSLNHP